MRGTDLLFSYGNDNWEFNSNNSFGIVKPGPLGSRFVFVPVSGHSCAVLG